MKKSVSLIATALICGAACADLCDYADPFVGSSGLGHTTPAACVPFGMVQAGPDTSQDPNAYKGGWSHCSGYQHTDPWIHRFSQTHLSGTGCVSAGDFGLMPVVGELGDRSVFSAEIDRPTEKASPGLYEVRLGNGIFCEISASAHSAAYRFTFPKGRSASVLVDLDCCAGGEGGRDTGAFWDIFASYVPESFLTHRSPTGLTVRRKVHSWIDYEIFSAMEFSLPIIGDKLISAAGTNRGERHLLSFGIPNDGIVEVRLALSMTSEEAASVNLKTEQPKFDFDGVKCRARAAWNDAFSRAVLAEPTDSRIRRSFYSALYRLCIQPNDIGDVGKVRYSTFSLWDTFRAAHPLYTILFPERVDGFVNSMLDTYDRNGYLPIWGLWGDDTHCMIGHHAVPVIVDAYLKGFRRFDEKRAYAAVLDSLTCNHKAVNEGTWGQVKEDWDALSRYGYLPFDGMSGACRGKPVVGESVSRLLEGCFDDACAARFAGRMGDSARESFFARRSQCWKSVIDPQTGWARGRNAAGQWREPFDPMKCGHCWFQDNDYTEGNAMQYTWHVMQDPLGLQDVLGGRETALTKLESIFSAESKSFGEANAMDVTGLIGQYAHGNEPSHHIAYFFTIFGRPERTAELVRQICETQYDPIPGGLCGNDDCGQMSAWYLFSAMGFYPFNPCGGEYVIGAPQVPGVTLHLANGKTFTMAARYLSKENKYVRSVALDGKPVTDWKIRHTDIMSGGKLVFEMCNER